MYGHNCGKNPRAIQLIDNYGNIFECQKYAAKFYNISPSGIHRLIDKGILHKI